MARSCRVSGTSRCWTGTGERPITFRWDRSTCWTTLCSGSHCASLALERTELTAKEVTHALEHESGMLALAGSADMRVVIENADGGDAEANLALEVYLDRLRGGIAAMAAAMNGLDVVVWTGGVGEHAPAIRAAAADGLSFLGLRIDHHRNLTATGDCDLTGPGAEVSAVVVSAREDLEIARQVCAVLS